MNRVMLLTAISGLTWSSRKMTSTGPALVAAGLVELLQADLDAAPHVDAEVGRGARERAVRADLDRGAAGALGGGLGAGQAGGATGRLRGIGGLRGIGRLGGLGRLGRGRCAAGAAGAVAQPALRLRPVSAPRSAMARRPARRPSPRQDEPQAHGMDERTSRTASVRRLLVETKGGLHDEPDQASAPLAAGPRRSGPPAEWAPARARIVATARPSVNPPDGPGTRRRHREETTPSP